MIPLSYGSAKQLYIFTWSIQWGCLIKDTCTGFIKSIKIQLLRRPARLCISLIWQVESWGKTQECDKTPHSRVELFFQFDSLLTILLYLCRQHFFTSESSLRVLSKLLLTACPCSLHRRGHPERMSRNSPTTFCSNKFSGSDQPSILLLLLISSKCSFFFSLSRDFCGGERKHSSLYLSGPHSPHVLHPDKLLTLIW